MSEKNKALFKSNDYSENAVNENYAFGNSFQVIYDNIKTLSFSGNVKAALSEDLSFGLNGTINSFTKDLENEVWNLPLIKLSADTEFTIMPQWYAGLSVLYVGQRKDAQQNLDLVMQPDATTLDGYLDLNAHLGYKYNDRLSAFLKINNILNQNYQKWLNFPVQGLQLMLGANYKFDF
jgi:outer membrane receptor protein involved in Fe transport